MSDKPLSQPADADLMQGITASPTWGTGGSFVFDPATGERITEDAWAQRQAKALETPVNNPPTLSTAKASKGA